MPGDETAGKSLPGRIASAIYPGLDEALWRRQRHREIDAAVGSGRYDGLLARHPEIAPNRLNARDLGRPPHIVVVPQEGYDFDSFRPGTRNFYYEAAQNLRELLGDASVSILSVPAGEPSATWHARLLDYLVETNATHVITHIEHDPGTAGASFTWDVFWSLARTRWDGVLLGVMFDSSYTWISAGSRHLARMSDRFVVVDICMPMDGSMVKGRPEVGPVNMPVSRESLALVDERLAGLEPQWDVSFIGVLYPYRQEMLDALRAAGVSVAVNPHRQDQVSDLAGSQQNQPSWLDYMAGLRSSRMTINFSQSSAGPYQQLKTRVLEATLARTLLLTDDRDRTRLFWTPDEEFVFFDGPQALPAVVAGLMTDPDRVAAIAAAGEARARALAHISFWGGIESGLRRRRLPSVLPEGPVA